MNLPVLPSKERHSKCHKTPKAKDTCLNIPVMGQRDPRGPDNNIRIWTDEKDQLHIRVEKTNRCYSFSRLINTPAYVEIIAD